MKRYNLEILAIQEARKIGKEKRIIDTYNLKGTILWSGHWNIHQDGVALTLNKEAAEALLVWKPISERLLYTKLKSRFANLLILVCYTPTENAQDEIKDNFYGNLQKVIEDIPIHHMLLVLGDLNAKVKSDKKGKKKYNGQISRWRNQYKWRKIMRFLPRQSTQHRRHSISAQAYPQKNHGNHRMEELRTK
jgi:hypothetical protein